MMFGTHTILILKHSRKEKAAAKDLKGTDGKTSVRKGDVRRGGSYEKRFSNVAVWNSVMPTYEYSLQKWYEFISA